MIVLLPKGKDIGKMLQPLTAESWQQIQQQMSPANVDLKLPRFESNTDIDLKDYMMKLGMTKAFDQDNAEFPNFCSMHTWIDLLAQVAIIKLDEEGTEAAAVTKDGVAGNEGHSIKYVKFHANHPFLYVISEKATGAIFFIGQYTGY